jgi:hypothetical protein
MADGCLVVRTIVMFGSGTHHLETVTYSLQLTSAVIPVCHLLPSSLPLIKFNVNTPKTVLSYPLFFFLLALWNELANGKLRSFGLREHQNSKLRAPLVLMSSAKHFCAFLLHEVPARLSCLSRYKPYGTCVCHGRWWRPGSNLEVSTYCLLVIFSPASAVSSVYTIFYNQSIVSISSPRTNI